VSKLVSVLIMSCLAMAACKSSKSDEQPGSEAPRVHKHPAAPSSPPSSTVVDIDLSPAGDPWKGWILEAPERTKVVDNGAGGITVIMQKIQFDITPGSPSMKDSKDAIESSLDSSRGRFPTRSILPTSCPTPQRHRWPKARRSRGMDSRCAETSAARSSTAVACLMTRLSSPPPRMRASLWRSSSNADLQRTQ
jgi:hypothetical protein